MRVIIAEDEVLVREGLTLILGRAGYDVVAAVSDADALVEAVDEWLPNVVITDIRMPPDGRDCGLRAATQIRVSHPGTGVVVLSQHVQRRYAQDLLAESMGGVGYLLKQRVACVEEFCRSVQKVAGGGTVLDPEVVSLMLSRARFARPPLSRLTNRQIEVLGLVAEGRSNSAIAAKLHVSEKAIVQHISRIYDALDLAVHDDDHRRVLAVLRYLAAEAE